MYGKILAGHQLPKGSSWIEHLNLLSAVRIKDKGLHHFKKLEEYIPGRLHTYLERGIREESDEFKILKEKFERMYLNTTCFVPHPLRDGYLFWAQSRNIEQIVISSKMADGCVMQKPLTEEQRTIIQEALALTCQDGSKDKEMMNAFWQEWDRFDNLRAVHFWWNSLEGSFDISQVGVALSNAYIHGKDPSIPCMC